MSLLKNAGQCQRKKTVYQKIKTVKILKIKSQITSSLTILLFSIDMQDVLHGLVYAVKVMNSSREIYRR